MKTYMIRWRSLINGTTGIGSYLFEKEDAEQLANELNQDYPGIHHEAVPGAPPPVEPVNGERVQVDSTPVIRG
jgi:hypothetical protein